MIRRVKIPWFIRAGIGPNKRGFHEPAFQLFGGDTETVNGRPLSLQLSDGTDTTLLWVDEHNALDAFVGYFAGRLSSRVNVCYFHHLAYDIIVLCYPFYKEIGKSTQAPFETTGRVGRHRWRLKVWFGKRCWARLWIGTRRVWLLDSWAFVGCSLEKIALKLNLPMQKLAKPPYLGQRAPTEDERPAFEAYAKADAAVAYHVGRWIIQQHQEFDVRLSVSLPQFAARVLRHHFFHEDERIELPPIQVNRWAELSYHGGKNGCYVKPGVYRNVAEADLTSAYAWAMTQIPQMVRGQYRKVTEIVAERFAGIYCISGTTGACRYPVFYHHDFTPIGPRETFARVWVTSYELFEALRHREVKLSSAWGVVWAAARGYEHHPLRDYNQTFFQKKETAAKGDPRREIFKLLCNALYGKFIQHTKMDADVTLHVGADGQGKIETPEYCAGGLYHPFLGSLITGLVRARLHALEVQYEALHTATDSIKTRLPVKETDGLGGLRVVVTGDCLLLRNKLYVHFDERGEIAKYALHGFQGTERELLAMVRERRTTYTVRRMRQVREALRRGLAPLEWEEQARTLDVPGLAQGIAVSA